MHNVRYDYSSLHVDVPAALADHVVRWGREFVHDNDIYVTQTDPTFGREDHIHVTVLYGIHTDQPDEVRHLIERSGPVHIRLGKVEVFTTPSKYDVLMIEAFSAGLLDMNAVLQEKLPHSNKYPVYHPHVTIAYVRKNRGWRHWGLGQWEGMEFACGHAVFSSKDGSKHAIIL